MHYRSSAGVLLSVCPAPGGGGGDDDDAGCGSQPVTCELQPREETVDIAISRGMLRRGEQPAVSSVANDSKILLRACLLPSLRRARRVPM